MPIKISIETQEKLYAELKSVLDKNLGDNGYAVLVSYYAGEGINPKTGELERTTLSHTITNLKLLSPMAVWRGILSGLRNKLDELSEHYKLKTPVP